MHPDGCHCSGCGAAQLVASGGVKESHETERLLWISSMWFHVMNSDSKSWQLQRSTAGCSSMLNAVPEATQTV